jgi:hypothetical protein
MSTDFWRPDSRGLRRIGDDPRPECAIDTRVPNDFDPADLYRAKLVTLPVSWGFVVVGSGGSSVFVDRAAEDTVAVDRGVERDDGGGVVVGRAVFAALVWAVVVIVSGELVEYCDGVAFVVDEHPVGAFRSHAPDEPLGITVGSGSSWRGLHDVDVRGGEHPSNDAAYLVSRSRMRNRNRVIRSPRFIRRLRAA